MKKLKTVDADTLLYQPLDKPSFVADGLPCPYVSQVAGVGARGEVYRLGQVLLRPAFGFASALDFLAQGMTVQAFFMLVHSYITPTLFYISGVDMRRNVILSFSSIYFHI